jgi:hypothetical protein
MVSLDQRLNHAEYNIGAVRQTKGLLKFCSNCLMNELPSRRSRTRTGAPSRPPSAGISLEIQGGRGAPAKRVVEEFSEQ